MQFIRFIVIKERLYIYIYILSGTLSYNIVLQTALLG